MSKHQKFVRSVVPAIGATLVTALYIVVDGIFIGRGIGASALAAVNLSVPFITLLTAVAMMVTMGGATITAIRLGGGDVEGANRAFTLSLKAVGAFALAVAALGLLFPNAIATALGASPQLVEATATYLKYYVLFGVFFCCAAALAAFVRNDGNPRLAFWGMMAGAFANVFLDWLFIFPLQLGIAGAAVASGLGQVLACGILLTHFIRCQGVLRIAKTDREPGLLKEVLHRGLPEFITQMGPSITIFCYNIVVIEIFGDMGVAAFSVVGYLITLTLAIFVGVSQGIQPLIGQSYGAGAHEDVRWYFKTGLFVNVALSLAVNLVMVAFGKVIIGLFNNQPTLVAIAYDGMLLYGLSFLFAAVNIVYTTYYLAVKQTGRAMQIAVLRSFVLNALFIFAVPALWGPRAVWLGIVIAEAAVMGVCCLQSSKRLPVTG